jgi:hypothetical protein
LVFHWFADFSTSFGLSISAPESVPIRQNPHCRVKKCKAHASYQKTSIRSDLPAKIQISGNAQSIECHFDSRLFPLLSAALHRWAVCRQGKTERKSKLRPEPK